MTFLVGLTAKLVGKKLAPLLTYAVLIAVLLGGLWWIRHDAYRDGERAENARWEKALDKAEKDAAKVAEIVGKEGDHRGEVEADRVKAEKERLDAAVEAGEDPFDVFFPGAD